MVQKVLFFLSQLVRVLRCPLGLAWIFLILLVSGSICGLSFFSQSHPHYGRHTYAIRYHDHPVEAVLDEDRPQDNPPVPVVNKMSSFSDNVFQSQGQPSPTPSEDVNAPSGREEELVPSTDLGLLKAPLDRTLIQKTPWGLLPIIGPSNKTCWQTYSRPIEDRQLPKICLVVQVLGSDPSSVLNHLSDLPPEMTLCFLPYTQNLNQVIDQVRCHGHEVLLSIPMEPLNLDHQDPGPYTLITGVPSFKNRENLYWSLGQGVGYVGVIPYLGHRFVSSRIDLKPVMDELHSRGLLFFDPKLIVTSIADMIAAELKMPYVMNHLNVDSDLIPDKIDEALHLLETIAQKNGYAVGTVFSYPLSLEKIILWSRTLADKGYQMVPVSSIVSLSSS